MPKMKGANWQGEHGRLLIQRYDIVCIHTIVGDAPAHQAQFSTAMDGEIFQSRDTKYRSAANYEGNHRIIAIENADMPPKWSDVKDLPDFTKFQIESIARIIVWCYRTHGIPIVACPDSRPGSRGIAYHRQGIDGNFKTYRYPGRVQGGERWSTSFGKVCPTDRRIHTLLTVIIPRARVLAGLDKPPEPKPPKPIPTPPVPEPIPEEDDMPMQPYRFYKFKGDNKVFHVDSSHTSRRWLSQDQLAGEREMLLAEAYVARVPEGAWSTAVLEVDPAAPLGKMLEAIPLVP